MAVHVDVAGFVCVSKSLERRSVVILTSPLSVVYMRKERRVGWYWMDVIVVEAGKKECSCASCSVTCALLFSCMISYVLTWLSTVPVAILEAET